MPFQPRMIQGNYDEKAYQLAMDNTKYNSEGKAVVEIDDEWRDETEWDDMYEQMKKEVLIMYNKGEVWLYLEEH